MSFRQHNNIRINILLQHVSTQGSHRQADHLRTVNTFYPLQYYTCNFCIRNPICITLCEYKKPGVGVVIAAVRPTRTTQWVRGGGVMYVPLYCLLFCVPACPRFIKRWCSSILFPPAILESSDLAVIV